MAETNHMDEPERKPGRFDFPDWLQTIGGGGSLITPGASTNSPYDADPDYGRYFDPETGEWHDLEYDPVSERLFYWEMYTVFRYTDSNSTAHIFKGKRMVFVSKGPGSSGYPDDEVHKDYERQVWKEQASGRLETNLFIETLIFPALVAGKLKKLRKIKLLLTQQKALVISEKQLGKKFGEHMSPYLPGYRSVEEYIGLANTIYNSRNSLIIKFPSSSNLYRGETHYLLDGHLLRLGPNGNFRSLYPILPKH